MAEAWDNDPSVQRVLSALNAEQATKALDRLTSNGCEAVYRFLVNEYCCMRLELEDQRDLPMLAPPPPPGPTEEERRAFVEKLLGRKVERR